MTPIRILILGTGGMANAHAEAYAKIPGVTVVAGVDTRPENLAAFQARHGIERGFATLADAIAWGAFDAASNVTPDAVHHATTMQLLAAGKHVLCEKPLAASRADAIEMAETAAKAGVINMVNLSYRNGAALQKAAQLVAAGTIGALKHFEASYLQSWLTQPAWGEWREQDQWLWRLSTKHGSKGVLGDVGIHIIDFATFIAGSRPAELSCLLKTFHKAEGDQIGDYPLDANDSFTMQLALENGAIGVIHASRFASGHHNDLRLRLYGDKGGIEVGFEHAISRLRLSVGQDMLDAKWVDVDCPDVPTVYETFIGAIRGENAAIPDFARGAALQCALDLSEESHAKKAQLLAVNYPA